jgi:hypothetical protein
MSASMGKVPGQGKAGRKMAGGLAGAGSAAAIVGAGIAALAVPGHAVTAGHETGTQRATLTASQGPPGTIVSTPQGGLTIAPPGPLVGPGTAGVNTFGFSGQASLNLIQAFPGLFGGSGSPAFNTAGLSTTINVTPPAETGISGFLPLNNIQNVFGSLFSPPVNSGQPALPSTVSPLAPNFIDPQPQVVNPDLENDFVMLRNAVANASVMEAGQQITANLQAIDAITANFPGAGAATPAGPLPFSLADVNSLARGAMNFDGTPAPPGALQEWLNSLDAAPGAQQAVPQPASPAAPAPADAAPAPASPAPAAPADPAPASPGAAAPAQDGAAPAAPAVPAAPAAPDSSDASSSGPGVADIAAATMAANPSGGALTSAFNPVGDFPDPGDGFSGGGGGS